MTMSPTDLRHTCLTMVVVFAISVITITRTAEAGRDIPVFNEVAASAGISHRYSGAWEYFVGGGVAAFDCNADRRPDLLIAGGSGDASLYRNESTAGGALRFANISANIPSIARSKITGVYPIDIDNDGWRDIVLLRVGRNHILKGGPDCTFQLANAQFEFDGGDAWTTAFAATFEAGLTAPTLAFGNYVDRWAAGSPWGTCHTNMLHRPIQLPNSGGINRPQASYREPQELSPGYCALSMLFTDWDRSGVASLRITNDRQYYRGGQEQLWRLPAGRPARQYRRNDGWRALKIWGMGIAETDLDGDGFPEYALTSMGDTKLQVLKRDGESLRPSYSDAAFDRGVTAHRPYTGGDVRPSTGWHAAFADFNNDALVDLFIAKGNVEQMPEFASFDPDNLLLGQSSGKFIEVGEKAGIAKRTSGRGAAIVDLNMDGQLDLVVVNRKAPVSVFRNAGGLASFGARRMGNWLQVELRQPKVNRDAVGAKIVIKTGNHVQSRQVQIGGGHASGQLGFVHAGLGTAERASIRIRWPDGSWSPTYRVFANNFVAIERGAKDVKYWYPEF